MTRAQIEAGERFVVKAQRPLASNALSPPLLVYNADRTVMWEVKDEGNAQDLLSLMKGEEKVYLWATLDAEGELAIHEDAPSQVW